MNLLPQEAFQQLVQEAVRNIYPKGKIKRLQPIDAAQLAIPGRLNDVNSYSELEKGGLTGLYMLVPDHMGERILEQFLSAYTNQMVIYNSSPRSSENDGINTKRIVFLNSSDQLDALRIEATYGSDQGLTNEDIIDHFNDLMSLYTIRIEDANDCSVGAQILSDINQKQADKLAKMLFEFNPEVANFNSDDEDIDADESEPDYYDDAPYFIKKVAKHLLQYKTFFYWWD